MRSPSWPTATAPAASTPWSASSPAASSLASPSPLELGAAFAPARKAGKLPRETVSAEYALEYGSALMELHTDALAPGSRVLLADDVLATGGTMAAARDLVLRLGGEVVGAAVLMELDFLNGRQKLDGLDVFSLIRY